MFTVKDEGPLPSLADLVEQDVGSEPSDDAMALLDETLKTAELPIVSTMGLGSNLRALVDRTFFRKFVRTEPEVECVLPWFDCHVPPGGKTTVRSSATTSTDTSCELKVYGSGIGAGRKTTITVSSSSEPRTACATYGMNCRIRAQIYETRGKESVELEIVKIVGESIETHVDCPFCGVTPGVVDPFDFSFGEQLDLRNDTVVNRRTFQLVVEKSLTLQTKLKVPTIAPELTLGARVSRSMSLDVEQEFPPHALYRGYTRAEAPILQTPMWAIERSAAHAQA